MYSITIVLQAGSLQCHRVFVQHFGKTVVRVKIILKVFEPHEIRDVEQRIVDSLPGIKYKSRLSAHNMLCYHTIENNNDFQHVPYNNEYTEVSIPFRNINEYLKQNLKIIVWGIVRNKRTHLWSMAFSLCVI